MKFVIFRNYYFGIVIKNIIKCNVLKTFALKNIGKFACHILEKLRPQSLAWTIAVLGLERVCPRKVVLSLALEFFSSPWPWPRRLCPRLHLCQLLGSSPLPTSTACRNLSHTSESDVGYTENSRYILLCNKFHLLSKLESIVYQKSEDLPHELSHHF